MEDFALDVMIGKGPSARSLRLTLKPFTIVGATTRAGRDQRPAPRPLRGHLPAGLLRRGRPRGDRPAVGGDPRGRASTTPRSRCSPRAGAGTPRIVNRLLRRVRDHAEVHGDGADHRRRRRGAWASSRSTRRASTRRTARLLLAIVQKFASGPVGVAALAAVLGEEIETVEDVYEPYLLRLGFLDRTPQGRVATDRGAGPPRRLGYDVPPPPGRARAAALGAARRPRKPATRPAAPATDAAAR